jgi:hypothetical protein
MTDQQEKVKGVADIVFLLDVTGSMQPCIDALKNNIGVFIDKLTTKDANNASPVKDWRAKVIGYRDYEVDSEAFIDNPFVREPKELKMQLSSMKADGGGDEPETLLDALYKIASMGQTEKGTDEDPYKWRYRSSAARVIILFSDATYKDKMFIPEAKGGGFDDIVNVIHSNKIILSIFAPDLPCYDKLGSLNRAEYEPIPFDAGNPQGPQEALAEYTSDQEKFKRTLMELAKSVSKSAETPSL